METSPHCEIDKLELEFLIELALTSLRFSTSCIGVISQMNYLPKINK